MNKTLGIVILALALVLSGFASYKYFAKNTVAANYKAPTVDTEGNVVIDPSEPKTEECPLNGKMLTKSHRNLWETRRPLGVMIENHLEARNQSGLSSADVVYESVAEGGITRFLSVFYCEDSNIIGPVRSARVYFIDLAAGYGANPIYTHIGAANCDKETGSGCGGGAPADARGKLQDLGWSTYNDIDGLNVGLPYFRRDPERLPGVAYEHTSYSSTLKLWELASERGLTEKDEEGNAWDADFVKWQFKEDAPSSKPIAKVSFGFWQNQPDYVVEWDYNKANNSYLRKNGGVAHGDKNTGKQLEAKNVIIAFAKESVAQDGYTAGQHMLYDVIGSNDALILIDGKVIKGSWEKEEATSQMRFLDESGEEVQLNRGQVFVEIVPEGNDITY